uniref:Uncharacterized protein n=1 Tax=Pan paniscus TaxID=9597 RepID=A0A2R9BCT6_PANPA
MWPQPYLPPDPMMLEETRQKKLAAAKKKLKEYQQRNRPGVPAGAKTKKKKTGSSPETTTSGGCHSPGDVSLGWPGSWGQGSRYQELEVALDSSSMTVNQLNENIESLVRKQQKKQVEHQLEEGVGGKSRGPYCLLHFSAEPRFPAPPAGTSELEQLQDEAKQLRKEVEGLEGKLPSQVENNQTLSLLKQEERRRLQEQQKRLGEQGERLRKQEQRLQKQEERLQKEEKRLRKQEERLWDQEKRLRKQEERLQKQEEWLRKQEERLWDKEERLQKQEERLTLSQNHKLDKQLAEPQCGFEDLNNENKSTLQLENQVKELQEKPGFPAGGAEEPRVSESAAAVRLVPGGPSPPGTWGLEPRAGWAGRSRGG